MTARYFSAVPISTDRVVLDGDEAHHLLRVMRAKPGDRITLFDGSGWEFEAQVATCQRRIVELAIRSRQEVDRELAHSLIMGVALPKGDRQKWLVEKLTELGVAELVPLQTERSVAQLGTTAIERLTRTVIEASKQCGRNRLMRIASPVEFREFLKANAGVALSWIADPSGRNLGRSRESASGSIVCAIGPEGGFSEAELDQAKTAGWKAISLGPRILRIETAAITVAARHAGE